MTGKMASNKKTSTKPAEKQATQTKSAKSTDGASASYGQKITNLTEVNRQLKRKIFDLYTIFEISRNFNAVLDYEMLLDTFILTSLAQVGASRAALFLRIDEQNDTFSLVQCKGAPDFNNSPLCFEGGSRLLEYITRLNRPVSTLEVIGKVADSNEAEILRHFHPGQVVPLIYQTRLSGVFVIADKISGRAFGMDDIEFLSILGSQISVAIENARLYKAEKMATEQLRSTQQQLVHSERLAALGEMSAKVAHEINNPLGIIKNYILLIKRAADTSPEATGYTEVVGQEIDRIARIVKELLDFHRPKGFAFEKIDITCVVDDVLRFMDQRFKDQNVKLVRNYDKLCSPVEASAENMKQVFMNALDVMLDGGELRVGVECTEENLLIRVCDTGPGILPEIIPRIFEPFFTTKDPGQGTGLGLSVCYGIIKSHKGTITYRNLDPGGCFEVRLPIVG
jgi:C4-dicarboxylate-specific signal transduction histidine kinase